ncbi:MAG: bacteriohemerythrin [Lachnospiraceae bacterium]|nr:bacteriohemerythrin [Lachnospiraceae bacterium]
MFTFTKDCLIGIADIDQEHERLFELIAQTDATLKSEDDSVTQAIMLIGELKQYAASHFAHEEAYMESIGDLELNRQKKEHASFVAKVNSYSFSGVTDETAKATILELLEYLSKWLMGHILGSDIMIGQFTTTSKSASAEATPISNKPAIPVFTDEFLTGIALVDEEHKKLFDIIGKVHKAIQTELVHDKFDSILDIIGELREYTCIHFADEENYMREIGYDGLETQEVLHQMFIDKLNDLDLNDVDDNQEAYLYDFLEFLQNWLVNHILKVDKLIPVK